MLQCVVLDDYQGVALESADWSVLDGRVAVSVCRERLTGPDLVAALVDAEIVVLMRERTPLTADLLGRLPRLRLLVTTGRRNASIDLDACRERGLPVMGTESLVAPPAEVTWALILGLLRHVVPEATAFRDDGPWQSTVGIDLAGATLGLVGLGGIGQRVARVGAAFDMDVVAWSPHLTEERAAEAGVRAATSLTGLCEQSDVVSLHLVLGRTTRGIVGADALAAMRPTAYLVNSSRAGLVDSDALLTALRERRIAGAGLDVYDVEPVPLGDELRRLPNVLGLPHLGYVTRDSLAAYYRGAVEDIVAFLEGRVLRSLL